MPNQRACRFWREADCLVPYPDPSSQQRCFLLREKIIASVFDVSNLTALSSAHLRLAVEHRSSFCATSSTKEMPRLSSTWSSTAPWMSAMYLTSCRCAKCWQDESQTRHHRGRLTITCYLVLSRCRSNGGRLF